MDKNNESKKTTNRSDERAKEYFIEYLVTHKNFSIDDIEVRKTPADIVAKKNGETYYYEIKSTVKDKVYFGAATISEWRAALNENLNYFFVVIKEEEEFEDFKMGIFTPEEFLEYSTIPPFKVNFHIDMDDLDNKPKHKTAVKASKKVLKDLINAYDSLPKGEVDTDDQHGPEET